MKNTTLEADIVSTDTTTEPSAERPAERTYERNPDYTLYKPNTRGNGAAIRFGFNRAKASVFVEAAPQSGERQFDWENKVIMKWGLSDLGAALAVLQGRLPQTKLFHQSDKANSAFELVTRDDPERAPLLLTISRQQTADKTLRKVSLPLTHPEAAILETILRTAVARIVGW